MLPAEFKFLGSHNATAPLAMWASCPTSDLHRCPGVRLVGGDHRLRPGHAQQPPSLSNGQLSNDDTFTTNLLPNTSYTVAVTLGDAASNRDQTNVYANGTQVLSNLATAAGQFLVSTFTVTTGNTGQLAMEFKDTDTTNPNFAIDALTIRQTAQVGTFTWSISTPNGMGTLPADGQSLATVTGTTTLPDRRAASRSSTTLGTITTADADPNYAGTQVAVTANGNITRFVHDSSRHRAGTATINALEVTGAAMGSTTLTLFTPSVRNFEFIASGGATETGYTGVLPSVSYSSAAATVG